jgi:hypothetical protein
MALMMVGPDANLIGETVYAMIRNATAQVWNGSAFVNYVDASRATYAIAMTPGAQETSLFTATIPAGLTGDNYQICAFKQAGVSPAITDQTVMLNILDLTDSDEVISLYSMNETLDDIQNLLIGPGADQVVITIEITPTPVADMRVWITTDANGANIIAGTISTNISGQVTFLLTYGVTYYLWAYKAGVNSIVGQSFVAASTNNFTTTAAAGSSTGLISLTEAREIVLNSVLHVPNGSYSNEKIDRAIQFAGRLFMRETLCVQKQASITLAADEREVDVQAQAPDFNYWMFSRCHIADGVYLKNMKRGDYARIQRAYENSEQTGRPHTIGFNTNSSGLLFPKPTEEYTMILQYAEPFVDWTPGASGSSVTINIPADFVRDVLWFGAGTSLIFGENYQNFYPTKGWGYFMQLVKDVKGMINIDSSDSYEGDGNGMNGTFGGGY